MREPPADAMHLFRKGDPLATFTNLEMLGHGSFGEVFQVRPRLCTATLSSQGISCATSPSWDVSCGSMDG